eukprot:580623-Prymnesium_polylepis.1
MRPHTDQSGRHEVPRYPVWRFADSRPTDGSISVEHVSLGPPRDVVLVYLFEVRWKRFLLQKTGKSRCTRQHQTKRDMTTGRCVLPERLV